MAKATQAATKNNANSAKTAKTAPKSNKAKTGKSKPKLNQQEVVVQYTPYVRSIAGKVKKSIAPEIDFEDLVEYGMIGLLEAADRFDPDHGVNFMTFAYYRIRGAIYDGLRGMGWMSRTEYAKVKYEERSNEYMGHLEEDNSANSAPKPTNGQQAASRLTNIVHGLAAIYITSLDAAEGLQVSDQEQLSQEEQVGLEEARRVVRETITKLNEQEQQLLEMYYYKDMSLQEIGDKLGLSKSWTSRLHTRVIEKLQRMLSHLQE